MGDADISARLAPDAEEYVKAADHKAAFETECSDIEKKYKEEVKAARQGLALYLGTQPSARLPDGRFLKIKYTTSKVAVNAKRIHEALHAVKSESVARAAAKGAVEDGAVVAAVIDALEEACKSTSEAPEISSTGPGELPDGKFTVKAPRPVVLLCKQLDNAQAALKKIRQHKRSGRKRCSDVMDTLHSRVEDAYSVVTGVINATAPSAPPPPPVLFGGGVDPDVDEEETAEEERKAPTPTPIAAPPVYVRRPPVIEASEDGDGEKTMLPSLPFSGNGGSDGGIIGKVVPTGPVNLYSDTVATDIRVRVKETKSAGQAPKFDAFVTRLTPLLPTNYRDFKRRRDEVEESAVELFNTMRATTARVTKKLKIERAPGNSEPAQPKAQRMAPE
jgi:hypothetical protein